MSSSVLSPKLKNTIKLRFLFNGHVHAQTFDCGDADVVPLSAPPCVAASQRYVLYIRLLFKPKTMYGGHQLVAYYI